MMIRVKGRYVLVTRVMTRDGDAAQHDSIQYDSIRHDSLRHEWFVRYEDAVRAYWQALDFGADPAAVRVWDRGDGRPVEIIPQAGQQAAVLGGAQARWDQRARDRAMSLREAAALRQFDRWAFGGCRPSGWDLEQVAKARVAMPFDLAYELSLRPGATYADGLGAMRRWARRAA